MISPKDLSTKNKKKRSYNLRFWIFLMVPVIAGIIISCDPTAIDDFGDINKNPTQATEMDDAFLLTTVQKAIAGNRGPTWRGNWIYSASIAQHVSSPWYPGEFYSLDQDRATAFWTSAYAGGWQAKVRHIQDVIIRLEEKLEEGEEVANRLAIARILRAFIFSRITDLYGDTPYFEAGKGYHDFEFTPSYDPQEEIYNDMFMELDEAVEQFDPAQPSYGEADLVYGGNIEQWQRFANSLRLRLALRLVKVAPQKAAEEAAAAVNAPGGVMTSNDDIWIFPHHTGPGTRLHTNPNAEVYQVDDVIFLSQTLVDWLQEREDSRLRVYGAVVKDDQVITDPEQQLGRPNGYTEAEVEAHPSFTGEHSDYTRLHPRFKDLEHPSIWFTYAEVEFMLAEAVVRGWISGNPATHYEEGVRAAMTYLTHYTGDTDISEAEINNYLLDNPFKVTGTEEEQLEQINEQYWVAVFMNGYEAWSNFRRSGYPDLEPSPVDKDSPHPSTDTGGEFPRRLVYPSDEEVLNLENFQKVLDRQGPNTLVTPVWWDAE